MKKYLLKKILAQICLFQNLKKFMETNMIIVKLIIKGVMKKFVSFALNMANFGKRQLTIYRIMDARNAKK